MIEESYPLAPVQHGMLVHSLAWPESGIYVQQLVCTWRQDLNIPAFCAAWRQIATRHPILRTSFNLQLVAPHQEVHREVEIPILHQNWSGLTKSERTDLLQAFLTRDRRTGFQFDRAPLLRHAIFRFSQENYRWVWTSHHALLDGRSRLLVLKEFFALYEAFRTGRRPLLEKPSPYRQYVDWFYQQDFARSEQFWRSRLSGFASSTPIGIQNRLAAPIKPEECRYGEKQMRLSKLLTSKLCELAVRCELTPNTFLQGAWALLLSRYSGERDIVLGATRAGRHGLFRGADAIIGPLINTVPVRVDVDPSSGLLDWLRQLRLQWIGLREHERMPLVDMQKCSEIPRERALFESLVTFENYQLDAALHSSVGESRRTSFRLIGNTNYPLSVAGALGRQLLLSVVYDRSRFGEDAVTNLWEHLKAVLEGMVSRPKSRISDLSLLTKAERKRILYKWNDTARLYPKDRCFHELFEKRVDRTPNNIAIASEGQKLTYGELNQRANQVAHRLRKSGVGPEVAVAVYAKRTPQIIAAMLGILKAGAAYVPLNPALPDEQLSWVIKDSRALLVLTEEENLERVSRVLTRSDTAARASGQVVGLPVCGLICLDAVWQAVAQECKQSVYVGAMPENLAYVIYTSGSTGKPKGTMIQHRSLVNYLNWFNQSFLPEGEVVLPTTTNLAFDASLKQVLAPLLRGGTVWMISEEVAKDPRRLLKVIGEREGVGFNCVPSFWRVVLDELKSSKRQSSAGLIKYLFLGGEPVSTQLVDETIAWMPELRIWNLYGPTETTANVSRSELKGRHSITIGRPIDNVRTHILDQNLEPVPVGVPGELHVGGIALARGYLNQPELTADRFVPDPFSRRPGERLYKTGDVARYRADGSVEYVSRLDDQVKVRGFRVELQAIETILKQYPAVRDAIVLSHETSQAQQELAAYVVLCRPIESAGDIRSFLRAKLPEYAVPSSFMILDALPLNSFGKLDRQALARMDSPAWKSKTEFEPPKTVTEIALARIWCDVLGVKTVGVRDNFFDLGGHSLAATGVIARIRDRFEIDLPIRAVFEKPTLANLAAAIEAVTDRKGSAISPPIRPVPRRLQRVNLS
jgi:amino acid adenylation domain-containing protein